MENAKNVKVLLRMPREMKADIEAIAYIENKKQSEIMRDAIAEYLKQHPIDKDRVEAVRKLRHGG